MKETAGDPRIVERATKIGNAADRCSRIVKSFLAMARQRPPERRAVDLCDIVQATLDVTGYSLRTANIEVRLELDPAPPPVRSEEHTSELQSLMRTSYAVSCVKKTTSAPTKSR